MADWNRRTLLRAAGLAAGAHMLSAAERMPNIVYVLADDLGWGDLHCFNSASQIPTPNADRLASQGRRFTDMHSPSAVCTPTRYGIITGRYCWRTSLTSGVLWGYSPNLIEPGRMTVASLLKSRGYHTAGFGKWHLGLGNREKADYTQPLRPGPVDHGFDYYFGIPASLDMEPYLYFENDKVVEQPTAHTSGRNEPRGVFWRPGPIAPGLKIEEVLPTIASKAVAYIRDRARKPDQPFFAYIALTSPHTPWLPTGRFKGISKAGDFGDFVAQTDDVLGQIMRVLDETGQAANTLLVFTSDNGADWKDEDKKQFSKHLGNGPYRGLKQDIYEAGHRIPFIARWPGKVKSGSLCSDLGCLTDLIATAADMADTRLPVNAGEDSISLLPALFGRPGKREAIVNHSGQGLFAIRQGEWKLVMGRGSGGLSRPVKEEVQPGAPAGQLYNLREDPAESRDIYAREPQVVSRLEALLEKYRREGRSRPA